MIRKSLQKKKACSFYNRAFFEHSGASPIDELKMILEHSGFTRITIEPKDESKALIKDWLPGANIEDYIVSAIIKAVKP